MTGDGLRAFVEGVERDVALVARSASAQEAPDVARLVASWGRLVDFLALGPAPELRACPHCGAIGMRAATRCGGCWRKLVPPGTEAAAAGR